MDVEYAWILWQGKNLGAISPVIYWSFRLSSRRGGDGVKGIIVILARYEFHFIRELENLV